MKLTKSKLKQLIREGFEDLQGEKRLGDAQAMSSDMRKDLMPNEYPAVQLDNDLAFDGMEANIESWTKEALNSGDGDLITELHDFLEELLDKNENPYRK
jgi:hypothetical protein